AATSAWNGVGWAASGAIALGRKAWTVYNDDFTLGILPDRHVPFGLPQSIYLGYVQWRYQQLELYDVSKVGDQTDWRPHVGPIAGNVSVNGQQNGLDLAAENALQKFRGLPCILAYNASVNLVSDTVESALLKFAPSAASRQLAELLTRSAGPVHLVGHS